MTERVSGFLVALEQDWREDDLDSIRTALRMLKGVAVVEGITSDMWTGKQSERLFYLRVRNAIIRDIDKLMEGDDGY